MSKPSACVRYPVRPPQEGEATSRRADRYTAQQHIAHQHSPERDRPLFAARGPEDRAPVLDERVPAPAPRDHRNNPERPPWQYMMFPAATQHNEDQFASANKEVPSSMSGSEDDSSEDEDDNDVVS